jgi:predicted phosphodiesterase
LHLVVLSDIHGNYLALRKVLDDVRGKGSTFVCLGDVAWGGPQPLEVLQELRELACPVVMGNTEDFLLGRRTEKLESHQKDLERWCSEILSDEDRVFIGGFKPTVSLDLDCGLSMLCYHGSPRSNREGIYATTSDAKIERILKRHHEGIFAGGHTHSQMVRRFRDRLIINPGSVGQPFEYRGKWAVKILPRAEYAVVDCVSGRLSVAMKRIDYGLDELRGAVAASDMPNKESWLRNWRG